jgi:hypothetical protein
MSYYPKHAIKTNLYTNGGEYNVKGTGRSYIGPYWQVANGRFFTGETPQSNPVFELVKINTQLTESDQVDTGYPQFNQKTKLALEGDAPEVGDGTGPYNADMILEYLIAQKKTPDNYPNRFLPFYNLTLPTQQDYQIGEFRRFFCKKVNEISYLEIDQDTYFSIVQKSPKITFELYVPFNIAWSISGNEEDVRRTNRNMVEYMSIKKGLPKFGEYLKFDYLKYYNKSGSTNVLANRNTRTDRISNNEPPTGSIYGDNSMSSTSPSGS